MAFKMTLEDTLSHFLDKHYDKTRPVLLGLSGGSDSLALLYLMESYKNTKDSFRFGIAHVDHGWRSESSQEAEQLQRLASQMNLPFHMKKLNPSLLSGNLEEACRTERLAFFAQLCHEQGYQAVILGHHADDQSETVLKKVLEGGSLPYLCGMTSLSVYQGLHIWRPLLKCPKSAIKQWLEAKRYIPFEDKTNFDKKFLRGRFRTKIIPELSEDFGKEIHASLCRIGFEAEELKNYLDAQLKKTIHSIVQGPFGSLLDLEKEYFLSALEIKYLIRRLCEKEGMRLSHHLIDQACQTIHAKSANCQLLAKDAYLYIDRRRLFAMKHPLAEFNLTIPIRLGRYTVNGWEIEVSERKAIEAPLTGWKEAWMGHMQVQVPKGNYLLKRGDSSLFKWWTNAKVPAFLRKSFPVLWSENAIFHEFLTKRRLSGIINNGKSRDSWLISIQASA